MNIKLIIISTVLGLSFVASVNGCLKLKQDNKRLYNNNKQLLSDKDSYIEMKRGEMKALEERYEKQLDSLNIRLKDVRQVSDFRITYKTDTVRELITDTLIRYIENEKLYRKYTAEYKCFNIDVLATEEPIILPLNIELEFNHFITQREVRFLGIVLKRKDVKHEFYNECGLDVNVNTITRIQ